MSVDTNLEHRNLASYHRVRHPEYRILVSPVLSGMVSRMRLATSGRILKKLVVELTDDRAATGDDTGDGADC